MARRGTGSHYAHSYFYGTADGSEQTLHKKMVQIIMHKSDF